MRFFSLPMTKRKRCEESREKAFRMESFRLFPHRDSEVCRKFVCQVRKVHRPFQRTLAEKAGYFYPVVVISFPGSSASYEEENLLRISLLAVGITLQTLPFVLIGVLLSTGMQLYSSRPPWKSISGSTRFSLCRLRSSEVLLSLLRLRADAAFQGFCKGVPVAITMIFLMAGPLTNPVVLVSTWYAFGGDLSMVGGRLLLGWLNAVLVGATFAFYKKNPLKAFQGRRGQKS